MHKFSVPLAKEEKSAPSVKCNDLPCGQTFATKKQSGKKANAKSKAKAKKGDSAMPDLWPKEPAAGSGSGSGSGSDHEGASGDCSESSSSSSSSSSTTSSSEEAEGLDMTVAELDGFEALAAYEEERAMLLVPAEIPAVIPAVPAAEETAFHVLSGDAVHHMSVGIQGLESARTGRSKCFFCGNAIREREVRLKYVPDLKKPTRWIHRDCAHNIPGTNQPSSVSRRRSKGFLILLVKWLFFFDLGLIWHLGGFGCMENTPTVCADDLPTNFGNFQK